MPADKQSFSIEQARADDVPLILEIANDAAESTAANFATAPEKLEDWNAAWQQQHEMYPWLVARRGSDVLGFAKASAHKSRGAYRWSVETSVYVDPRRHGQGIGSALYKALFSTLRAQGYVTVLAGIAGGNDMSERLHARAGFVRCATYHRLGWKFGRWHDVSYWELHLHGTDFIPGDITPATDAWFAVQTQRQGA